VARPRPVLGRPPRAQQSQGWFVPLLKRLAPHATPGELGAIHIVLRKLGHLTGYAMLALLWLRGFLVTRRLSLRTAAWAALLVCVGCAFVDEAHQSMLLSRTAARWTPCWTRWAPDDAHDRARAAGAGRARRYRGKAPAATAYEPEDDGMNEPGS